MRLGEELGVTGTPTVIINAGGMTRRIGENSFQAIQAVMESVATPPEAAADTTGSRP
jgi:protein-disulfide isomerase